MNSNRPLLAEKLAVDDLPKLRYPLYASPKFDGIRVRIDKDLWPLSRVAKVIPNLYFQQVVKAHPEWAFLDGEVVVGQLGNDQFNATQSGIMSAGGTPDFVYWVFDYFEFPEQRYDKRFLDMLTKLELENNDGQIRVVEQIIVNNVEEVLAYEEAKVNEGYEGIMLRSPHGRYKFGRSTARDRILMKLKRFEDAEATIIGVEPLEHNNNAATFSELGYTKRSSHKQGKEVDHTLMGALTSKNPNLWKDTFSVGSGFTIADRKWFMENADKVIGKSFNFKYLKTGSKDRPRHPIYKGLRYD